MLNLIILSQICAQFHKISSSSSHAYIISYGFVLIYHNFITFYHGFVLNLIKFHHHRIISSHFRSRICANFSKSHHFTHILELGSVEFYQISSFCPILHHFLQQICSFKGILLANLKYRRSATFYLFFNFIT